MIFMMKQTTLEPGLLQTLRVYVILMTILLPFVWRAFSRTLGVEGSLSQYLTPGQPVVVFLIIYLSFPWWQRRMGRAFLPVAFLLLAAQAIFGNYLTLQWLVPPPMRDTAARAGLRLELDVRNHLKKLTPHVEQCVYRVAQEALTNVARHADAKTLRAAFRHDAGSLALTVADDGSGFDLAQVSTARYGLKGLRERAEMIGAALHVDSALETGTTISLVVPSVE